jgi:PKD repeat protein
MLAEVEEVASLAEPRVLKQGGPYAGEGMEIPYWAVPAAIVGGIIVAAVAAVAVLASTPPPPPPPGAPSVTASGSPQNGPVPLTVYFSASPSGGTPPYSYAWDFGDGVSSALENPSHTYQSAGSYTATVTVTDSAGKTAQASVPVGATSVTPPPPTQLSASITPSPTSGVAPLTVNFASNVSGGTAPYTYAWNFGDGGSSSSANPTHAYDTPGTYNVKLSVVDSAGNAGSATATITVSSQTPSGGVNVVITQTAGSLPYWHITGLTPGGPFEVVEEVPSVGAYGNQYNAYYYFYYTADSTGSDSRAFKTEGATAGTKITLKVTDKTTGQTGTASYTLLS